MSNKLIAKISAAACFVLLCVVLICVAITSSMVKTHTHSAPKEPFVNIVKSVIYHTETKKVSVLIRTENDVFVAECDYDWFSSFVESTNSKIDNVAKKLWREKNGQENRWEKEDKEIHDSQPKKK